MRVLLAVDGSPGAAVATDLVASLDWPHGTQLRVVSALADQAQVFASAWAPAAPAELQRLEDELLAVQESQVAAAVAAVARPGVVVEGRVVRGRAATAIVDEAAEFVADLVVIGSRGHGAFENALVGSVSAEVVDHAPCPVLVARRGHVHRVMLADDGSPDAGRARGLVRDWPILRDQPVCVVSVATVPVPWEPAVAPMAGSFAADSYTIALSESRRAHAEVAHRAHDELAVEGRPVEYSVRVGSPAGELVAAAVEWDADLVVIGSHGRTGLRRVLLGSVARSVLLHAPCSVLVVRHQAVEHASAEATSTGELVQA